MVLSLLPPVEIILRTFYRHVVRCRRGESTRLPFHAGDAKDTLAGALNNPTCSLEQLDLKHSNF